MSEYQYYEFLALDRPLDEREMADLRSISTRADVTPTGFSNEYNFGDLKADPGKLLERYFDVQVYVANWGTQHLALRLPSEAVDAEELALYLVGDAAAVRSAGKHIVIDLRYEAEESQGWVEGRGWMGSLAGVRAELLRGDQRPLYLAWLLCVVAGEVHPDDEEPPVPPGLGELSASLASLIDFLRIDAHLVAAAAEASAPAGPEPRGMAQWIARLPVQEKDALLLQVAQGEHAHAAAALVRRFRSEAREKGRAPALGRRTVEELLTRAGELREAERRRQERAAEKARRAREAAAAAARVARLDAVAERKPAAWRDVQRLVESKVPKAYDQAVQLLADLRDVAAREGDQVDFAQRLRAVRETHSRKSSFLARLDRVGLR